ncbi:hypothetical protein HC256_002396 [Beauveria bassiana]|nr:hypothetical protein HC256_002396 [Beauveria bassiana]
MARPCSPALESSVDSQGSHRLHDAKVNGPCLPRLQYLAFISAVHGMFGIVYSPNTLGFATSCTENSEASIPIFVQGAWTISRDNYITSPASRPTCLGSRTLVSPSCLFAQLQIHRSYPMRDTESFETKVASVVELASHSQPRSINAYFHMGLAHLLASSLANSQSPNHHALQLLVPGSRILLRYSA